MFKSLFGGNKEEKHLKQKLQQIEVHLENKEFEKVISEGEDLLDKVSDKQRKTLVQMLALANFHSKEYEKALPYFRQLIELDKNNPDSHFNICTCFILNKQPEQGLESLEEAINIYQEKGKKENMPIPYMIFYTICALIDAEEYNLAFDQLNRLATVYKEMSITDTHFLYTRGYVPFHNLLEKVKDILIGQTKTDSIEWLTEFASHLDEDGQAQVEELIEDLKAEKLQEEK
jgi:Tfp pilus assembly protein PilF